MTSDQLLVLDAIVKAGSFNAAAQQLNRVPSAISYSIKMLEQDLGLTLFCRKNYRPSLTEEGQAIYRRARLVLQELDDLHRLAQQIRLGQEPLIRLDVSPICPTPILTEVLKSFSQAFPQTQLKMSMEIFGGEQLVLHKEADLTVTDLVRHNPELEDRLLLTIPMLAVASPKHPLAQGNRTPSKQALVHHFQVVAGSQTSHMEQKSLGIMSDNTTWRVNDFPTKRHLILEGLGWGHLPATMVAEDLAAGDLVVLDIVYLPKNKARLSLVRRRAPAHGPVASHLWDLITTATRAFEAQQPSIG